MDYYGTMYTTELVFQFEGIKLIKPKLQSDPIYYIPYTILHGVHVLENHWLKEDYL